MTEPRQTAIIIGAGPAGLTAAYELLKQTSIVPIVFEASGDIGGISRTVEFHGNRIDIGGHRFFSKSDRVMRWWNAILPIENTPEAAAFRLAPQGEPGDRPDGPVANPELTDDVMLVRSRLSRIYYGGKFYNYPITLEAQTIRNLGFRRMATMGVSYLAARIRPRPENNLEDFYINRFGRELYNTFFRDYTAKVWGVPCSQIAPDWGAQRVKGLSVTTAISHALRKQFRGARQDLVQKNTQTSLIEFFLYPKLGPGHMWETVARKVEAQGGQVHRDHMVTAVNTEEGRIVSVDVNDASTGVTSTVSGDYIFSTMAVKDLIGSLEGVAVPDDVARIASTLPYRDFITVGLLLRKLKIRNETDRKTKNDIVPDNWIYIQDPGVAVGRLQVFNNWSPYLVANGDDVWLGMEYFCTEGDEMWTKPDSDMAAFAISELASIGVIDPDDVLDSTVIRVPKTYPAYFGSYAEFDKVQKFTDRFENLFLIGRNGQHRYNNQDHSMLTAMVAVENIVAGRTDKANLWSVNAEQEYHESK